LGEAFRTGDPLVAQDLPDGYYVEWSGLQDSDGQIDLVSADALIKRINGVGRAIDQGFRPVRLQGRYTAPDGSTSLVFSGDTAEVRLKAWAGTVMVNGITAPEPPPRGPLYVKLSGLDPDVADALRVLGQPDSLDWYDIYKVWEIIAHAAGGRQQVITRGWATNADIDRLTASANHPGISGDEARHARMPGTPEPARTMTISEADALVRQLAATWIESHPRY
jgi:hypothetical protein